MYKLSTYENKMSYKYRTGYTYYRYLWQAKIVSSFIMLLSAEKYGKTGVLTTTEIEKHL